jgi:hypothetical protein
MKGRKHTPKQIMRKLRAADRLLGERQEIAEVAKQLEISEATFHRWRAQYGGLKAQANPSCLAHDHWKLLSPARHWDPRAGAEFSHIPDPDGNSRLNQSGERRARSASWHQIRSWWPAGPRPTRSGRRGSAPWLAVAHLPCSSRSSGGWSDRGRAAYGSELRLGSAAPPRWRCLAAILTTSVLNEVAHLGPQLLIGGRRRTRRREDHDWQSPRTHLLDDRRCGHDRSRDIGALCRNLGDRVPV